MAITGDRERAAAPAGFDEVHQSAEFQALRRAFRTVVFPATAAFLLWYATYVLLAAFATDLMSTRVVGNVTVGLVFGLGQFATTFAITTGYRRWADRHLDPGASALRERLEGGAR